MVSFCTACGTPLSSSEKFCRKCGAQTASPSTSDFSFTINVAITRGERRDGVGVRLSSSDEGTQGIYAMMFTTGTGYVGENNVGSYSVYTLPAQANGTTQPSTLIERTETQVLHPDGVQNEITLVKKGSNLALILNRVVVNTFSDDNVGSSYISLFLCHLGTDIESSAIVKSVKLTSAPDQLPQPSQR
jgi:hypothetical protein